MLDARCWILDAGCSMLGGWMLDAKYKDGTVSLLSKIIQFPFRHSWIQGFSLRHCLALLERWSAGVMVIDLLAMTPPLHYPKAPCWAFTAFVNLNSKLKQHRLLVSSKSDPVSRIRGPVSRLFGHLQKLSINPTSALCSNCHPRNTMSIPPVKIFACLELGPVP